MRILLSYAAEYDRCEAHDYARVLRRLGHEVVPVNTAAMPIRHDNLATPVRGYPPGVSLEAVLADHPADLFLYVEPLGLLPRGLERSPIPTACVLSDVNRKAAPRLRTALLFDRVFVYKHRFRTAFTRHPAGTVHWWPYALDETVFRDPGVERDLDVAFIGRLYTQRRRELAAWLGKRCRTNEQRYYARHEIPRVYGRARIVINVPDPDTDFNWRVMEAMFCGAMLLTPRSDNGQDLLFEEGTHFVSFSGDADLRTKLDYYLSHDDERARIAAAGRDLVHARHTLSRRIPELLEKAMRGEATAPARSMPAPDVALTYAAIYEHAGQVDPLLALAAEQPRTRRVRFTSTYLAARVMAKRVILGW